jgi:hypothetical protein
MTATVRHLLISGDGLTIYDIRDPRNPEFIRHFEIGYIDETLVHNGYAYACKASGDLRVIDLYGAAGPDTISHMPASRWHFSGFAAIGGYVYMQSLDNRIGLVTVDARDPYHPTTISNDPEICGWSIKIVGSRLYISSHDMLTVDISDPGHPLVVDRQDLAAPWTESSHDDGILWVGNPIRAFSLSDPDHPSLISELSAPGILRSLSANGGQLTVFYQDRGVKIYDIDDPSNPRLRLNLPAIQSRQAKRVGNIMYVATADDYSLPSTPTKLSTFDLGSLRTPQPCAVMPSDRRSGSRFGDLLITGVRDGGFRITRIHPGPILEEISLFEDVTYPIDFELRDGLLYTVTGTTYMSIYDITDLSAPVLLGRDVPWDRTTSLVVVGSRAYSGSARFGLQIRNIENPARPRHTGYMSCGGSVNDVTVVRGYIMAITSNGDLLTVDISNPDEPTIANNVNLGVALTQIMVHSGIAFIATASSQILAMNVDDPLTPTIVGTVEHRGGMQFTIDGTVAAIANGPEGAVFVDIGDPRNMAVMGQYLNLQSVEYVLPLNGAFLLHDGTGNAHLVLQPCETTTRIDDADPAPANADFYVSPNPFNPRTTIRFASPGNAAARLEVFDLRGRLVATLYDATSPQGTESIDWDGRDNDGAILPSGVYQLNLSLDGMNATRKITILK